MFGSLNPFGAVNEVNEIIDLVIYPIKSCRGISLKNALLTGQGLELDRRWMFVDAESHKFVTIRELSSMSSICNRYQSEHIIPPTWRLLLFVLIVCFQFYAYSIEQSLTSSDMTLINTAITPSTQDPGTEDLTISISGTSKSVSVPARPTAAWLEANTTLADVIIWDYETDGYVYSDAINSAFNSFFDKPVKLVYKGPTKRILRGNAAPDVLGRIESTNFPDVMPLLVANEKSLVELNGRLTKKGEQEITVERFRANIIIRGEAEPWSEDSWKTVRISPATTESQSSGGILGYLMGSNGADTTFELDIRARCARCQVPNVDPVSAVKDKHEPWDTLVSYRRIDQGIKWKPCFGMLGVTRKEGEIKVGMKFEVLERTDKHNYKTGF